jgi:hypothetical protein
LSTCAELIRRIGEAGNGIRKVAKTVGLGTSTVQKVKNEMLGARKAA